LLKFRFLIRVAHGAHARRSDDPLDAPVPGPRGRQLRRFKVPLIEETEAYEVEILNGAIVKRTLSATTTRAA